MKRLAAILLFFLIIFLTACSGQEPSQNVVLPDSSSQKQIVDPNDSSQDESIGIEDTGESDEEHLAFYDRFDLYNENSYFPGFILSEEWIDGEPFYQLWNEEKDVKILVDKTQENAVLYHNGKSMEYEIGFLLTGTSASTGFDVLDLTNDGKDELVIYQGAGGTGVWEGISRVFDLETFQEYEIDETKILKELSTRITVEPLEIVNGNSLKCRIRDVYDNTYYGYLWVDGDDASQYAYIPEYFTGHYSFEADPDRQCLVVTGAIPISPMYASYIGTMRAALDYNPETGCFELSDELVIELDRPADEGQ